jgi:hypothetical protein
MVQAPGSNYETMNEMYYSPGDIVILESPAVRVSRIPKHNPSEPVSFYKRSSIRYLHPSGASANVNRRTDADPSWCNRRLRRLRHGLGYFASRHSFTLLSVAYSRTRVKLRHRCVDPSCGFMILSFVRSCVGERSDICVVYDGLTDRLDAVVDMDPLQVVDGPVRFQQRCVVPSRGRITFASCSVVPSAVFWSHEGPGRQHLPDSGVGGRHPGR